MNRCADDNRVNARVIRSSYWIRIATLLCGASVATLILALPFGRPLATWFGAVVAGSLVIGVLFARLGGFAFRGMVPVALFAASGVLSTSLSSYSEISWNRASAGLILLFVFPAAQVIAQSAQSCRVIGIVSLMIVLGTVVDLAWQPLFGRSLLLGIPAPAGASRYSGSLPNPNEVAFLAIAAPIAMGFGLRAKAFRVVVGVGTIAAAVLCGSRAMLLGLAAAASLAGGLATRRRWWGIGIALSTIAMIAITAWIVDLGSVRARVSETLHISEDSRIRVWRIAYEAWLQRPMIGNGPCVFFEIHEASRSTTRPSGWETPLGGMPWVHNLPLEILCERGMLGFALAAIVALSFVRDLKKSLREKYHRAEAFALASAAAAFATMSMFDLSLLKDWCALLLWLIAGLAAGFASRATQNSDAESRAA